MNVENMLKVADLIEQHPQQFDMESPYRVDIHDCGTVGCIAGFAEGLLPERDYYGMTEIGHLVFDIPLPQSQSLFFGGTIWVKYADDLGLPTTENSMYLDMGLIKPHHAVTMLRNLASGKWSF